MRHNTTNRQHRDRNKNQQTERTSPWDFAWKCMGEPEDIIESTYSPEEFEPTRTRNDPSAHDDSMWSASWREIRPWKNCSSFSILLLFLCLLRCCCSCVVASVSPTCLLVLSVSSLCVLELLAAFVSLFFACGRGRALVCRLPTCVWVQAVPVWALKSRSASV